MASSCAASSYTTASNHNYSADDRVPRFSEYRSQLMLGDLPEDFLRVKIHEPVIIPPDNQLIHPGYAQHFQNPQFLGFLTLTIAEAKLVKGSGYLGLVKADPYVTFRIGHVQHETAAAVGGGKNPQWKATYRLNLFRGMDRIYFQVLDQRNFTEDTLIGECEVVIPREVLEGETRQTWYQLFSRESKESQGDILIVMSFVASRTNNVGGSASGVNTSPEKSSASASGNDQIRGASANSSTNQNFGSNDVPLRSASAVPKPAAAIYSPEDVKTIHEMFPTTDRRTILELLDKNGGNKDLVVNHLLQNAS